jgi:hypothetical protein
MLNIKRLRARRADTGLAEAMARRDQHAVISACQNVRSAIRARGVQGSDPRGGARRQNVPSARFRSSRVAGGHLCEERHRDRTRGTF